MPDRPNLLEHVERIRSDQELDDQERMGAIGRIIFDYHTRILYHIRMNALEIAASNTGNNGAYQSQMDIYEETKKDFNEMIRKNI